MSEKSSDAFRTISEVADDLHVPQHVLRFWEGRFPQIKPLKRAGGRRYYRPEDIELLARIRDLLYTQGYTIKGVQNLLKEGLPVSGGEPPVSHPHEEDGEEGRPSFALDPDAEAGAEEGGDALPPPAVRPPEEAPPPAKPDTVSPPPMFGLFSRPEPPPPVVAPQAQAVVSTGLSKSMRDQLGAIMDELEQLRFLLRPQD